MNTAAAHDWYSAIKNSRQESCCGGRDCGPVPPGRLSIGGDGAFQVLIVMPGGATLWLPVAEDRVVRDAAPDGQPHVCIGHVDGAPVLRCLILPRMI